MGRYKHEPKLVLSVGLWHLMEQAMNFGNPTAGGFKRASFALSDVAEMNKELKSKHRLEFAVSAHWWHEILVPESAPRVGHSAKFNNNRSIDLTDWMAGVQAGKLAPIGRIIPPGFGIPGADDGAFIHPDPERRKLAHNMMVYSFQKSEEVQKRKVGRGHVIYWTGPDGIRWKRLVEGKDVRLGYNLNPNLEEWKLIVNGVGNAAKEARELGFINTRLLIEGKAAGDPCYMDVFTDPKLEVMGINAINDVIGVEVAEWQGELAHERGAGVKFSEAMKTAINGGTFNGAIHLNSGGLAGVNFSELLDKPKGTWMSEFPQYVDNDFLPGEGVKEWVDDQKQSIKVGTRWSAITGNPFEVEFDARFSRYPNTIEKLYESAEWTIGLFNEEAKRIASLN